MSATTTGKEIAAKSGRSLTFTTTLNRPASELVFPSFLYFGFFNKAKTYFQDLPY
jgi:hypothetical protein